MASNDTSIKYFRFDNKSAPQLDNVWGCMIEVLNACLVNGFGDQPVSSIVIANGVGTATFPTAHAINLYQVVSFAGTGIVALHTEFKVLGVTTNTIQFLVNLPDQTVNGSITCRLPGLGWSQPYYGTHKAVYRAKDTLANPFYLRVDNSLDPLYNTAYAKFAKVGILETCTGIDDLSGKQAPFDAANPTINWVAPNGTAGSVRCGWTKWYHAVWDGFGYGDGWGESAAPVNGVRPWIIVGTKDSFYIINSQVTASAGRGRFAPYGFCSVKHNELQKPYLFASININNPHNVCNPTSTGLSIIKTGYIASFYTYTNESSNTSFASTYPGVGDNASGINASNTAIGYDPATGYILSDLYIMDKNRYLLPPLPLLKHTPHDMSNVSNYTLFGQPNETYIGCTINANSISQKGMLLMKVYDGAPL